MHISTKHNTRKTTHNSKHLSIQYTQTHYSARPNPVPQYTLQYHNYPLHHQYTVYKSELKLITSHKIDITLHTLQLSTMHDPGLELSQRQLVDSQMRQFKQFQNLFLQYPVNVMSLFMWLLLSMPFPRREPSTSHMQCAVHISATFYFLV